MFEPQKQTNASQFPRRKQKAKAPEQIHQTRPEPRPDRKKKQRDRNTAICLASRQLSVGDERRREERHTKTENPNIKQKLTNGMQVN